jgi:hypothetical protein
MGKNLRNHVEQPVAIGEAGQRVLMNKAQCAAFLGIKIRTLDKYVHEKRIPFIRLSQKLVRFHVGDVLFALRNQP